MSDRVGVRELRQNLSRYLRRVEQGERLVVTERNRPVAALTPLTSGDDAVGRLVSAGRLIGPETPRLDFRPVQLRGDRRAASRALEQVRSEDP